MIGGSLQNENPLGPAQVFPLPSIDVNSGSTGGSIAAAPGGGGACPAHAHPLMKGRSSQLASTCGASA